MSYILGIDGGGSKTVCIVMDKSGQIVSRGEAGSSNYQSVGQQTAAIKIAAAIGKAVASIGSIKVKAIGLGLAGIARPRDFQVAQKIVQQLQVAQSIPPQNIVIAHDALVALVGGIGKAVGIVAIAGTGSIVFGRNAQGETRRVGGWGPILGDEAGAYAIAVGGMRAALRAYDGRASTCLPNLLKEHLGLQHLEDLVEVVYRSGWGVKEIAALAPLVDRAATLGDRAAQSIIKAAVADLAAGTQVVRTLFDRETPVSAGTAVQRRCTADSQEVEVATVGSVWQMSGFRARFAETMRSLPATKVITPRHEPAYGAGLLALDTLM